MGFETGDLIEYLETDPDVRILIVEGKTDITVWHYLVPASERINCVIYPIDEIDVTIGLDGNKGAAVALAAEAHHWKHAERVRFFLDSDCDEALGKSHTANVILTDSRDMESHVLIDELLDQLCSVGASENAAEADLTKRTIERTVRPLGILRIASARNGHALPFQDTFKNGTVTRFFDRAGKDYQLSMGRTVDGLIRQAGLTHASKAEIMTDAATEILERTSQPTYKLVHGKDLVAFLAWYFKTPMELANGLVLMSIMTCANRLRDLPNLGGTINWLKAA